MRETGNAFIKVCVFMIVVLNASVALGFGWPKDYKPTKHAEAIELAKSNKKPIAIYYSLSYCPGCRTLSSQLRDSKIYDVWAGNLNAVSIDPGADLNQAEKDRIKAEWGQIVTPTMTFFSPQGNYVCFMRGSFNNIDQGAKVAVRLLPLLVDANASPKPRDCAEILWKKT